MNEVVGKDMPITIQEAMLFWSKSKKQVYWALWREQIKARQSCCSENWIISFNSCVRAWGAPTAPAIAAQELVDWNGD